MSKIFTLMCILLGWTLTSFGQSLPNTFPNSGPVGIGTTNPSSPVNGVGLQIVRPNNRIDVDPFIICNLQNREDDNVGLYSLSGDTDFLGALAGWKGPRKADDVATTGLVLYSNLHNSHDFANAPSAAMRFQVGKDAILRVRVNDPLDNIPLYEWLNGHNNILMRMDARGYLGIGAKEPRAELHIRDQQDGNRNTVVFIEPREWNSPGDYGELRFGDRFHFIRGENRVGMTISDYNAIIFNTGGREAQTRMVINGEGNVGVGTTEPKAQLHNKGTFRLEELPIGQGEPLVLDKEGNVFVSRGSVPPRELVEENQRLQEKVNALEERLAKIEALLGTTAITPDTEGKQAFLQSINPNPFDQNTNIRLFVPQSAKQASLIIYDMQGAPLKTVEVLDREEVSIAVQAYSLKRGLYHCALIVDGKEIDIKRMIRQ